MESLQPPLPDYLTAQILEEIFSDNFVNRVIAARRRPMEQKFLLGGHLFELAHWHLRWAAQIHCPQATNEECKALVQRFLDIADEADDPEPKPPQ